MVMNGRREGAARQAWRPVHVRDNGSTRVHHCAAQCGRRRLGEQGRRRWQTGEPGEQHQFDDLRDHFGSSGVHNNGDTR
jgi:hypothetical protein